MSVRCISPVNNELYTERPYASEAEIDATFSRAKQAQRAWAQVSIAERAAQVVKVVDTMLAMREAITEELAWLMGRPVRFGAGELGGYEERARFMIDLADTALAPVTPDPKEGFTRFVSREPLGTVFAGCALELSVPDRGKQHRTCLDGGKCGGAKACCADPVGGGALPDGV